MNTPVTFLIAKLLKEKGFDEPCDWGFDFRGGTIQNFGRYIDSHLIYHAATIAEIVMWLYKKHGIWVGIDKDKEDRFKILICQKDRDHYIKGVTLGNTEYKTIQWHNSPTEAYLDGIEYVLTQLIKII